MQQGSHDYAFEKLRDALECLATLPGDVRERLLVAYECFAPLKETDLPAHLHQDWQWVLQQLTRYGPVKDYNGVLQEGSVNHTLRRIKNSTGSKIAQKIYEIYRSMGGNTQYD